MKVIMRRKQTLLVAGLFWGAALFGGLESKVEASQKPETARTELKQNSSSSNRSPVIFAPPRRGKPNASIGAASRTQDTCTKTIGRDLQATLTPLVDTADIALTANSHPELAIHIGEANIGGVFFAVRDEAGRHLYQDTVMLSGETGIARIQLPAEAPELEVGQRYLWSVVAMCGPRLKPDSPRVDVWVERVPLERDLIARLDREEPLEKATALGARGIWLDLVETLADARAGSAEELAWQQIMEMVGLQAIAAAPFLPSPAVSLPSR